MATSDQLARRAGAWACFAFAAGLAAFWRPTPRLALAAVR